MLIEEGLWDWMSEEYYTFQALGYTQDFVVYLIELVVWFLAELLDEL